ncbi:MAG: cytochrome c-type biogenesis protein CcmH [bacterium]
MDGDARRGDVVLVMKGGMRSTVAFVICLAAFSLGASAPGTDVDREAYRVAHDLMSPFCPGRTLADCPSPYAREVRQEIRESLASGMTASEVTARVTAELGDEVRGRPRSSWGWAIPALVTLGGLVVAFAVIRRLALQPVRRANEESPSSPSADPLAARLDDELRALS